ncbi:hypothetical protein SAMN02745912_00736 [Paramaledivibacter caminithermalis DSM 15212]|uniref:Uncharacterized protein n=1 Tax=Paramaledivibacter caminithermalis (strain DSM 15212 / CIP 107654 / DViRD3) TaxID=1121301 RepID=A0A1M6LD14_PARC5|nr:hypothetical protein SAMN02745912_00736 [Paramaledivibacter caminithermalis DSM 15212]
MPFRPFVDEKVFLFFEGQSYWGRLRLRLRLSIRIRVILDRMEENF